MSRDGLLYQLKSQAFKGDDMLQEGLAEVVESKTFKIRVVKATNKNATTETIIEDGIVYMQVRKLIYCYKGVILTLVCFKDYP
jgi:hypothetical protein